jgi:membrane protease YdiL (CAAX protease family)
MFKSTARTVRYSLWKALYILIIALIALPSAIWAYLTMGESAVANWPLMVVYAIALCVVVALFEELLFRVALFGGLLGPLGGTRGGIFAAALIASLLFGFVHVLPSLFSGDVYDVDTALQALFKTMQTAMIGLLLCAIYLRTHNLWGIVAIHFINDACSLTPLYVFGFNDLGSYVGVGVNAAAYGFALIIYVPVIVVACVMLSETPAPDRGCFMQDYTPLQQPIPDLRPQPRPNAQNQQATQHQQQYQQMPYSQGPDCHRSYQQLPQYQQVQPNQQVQKCPQSQQHQQGQSYRQEPQSRQDSQWGQARQPIPSPPPSDEQSAENSDVGSGA